MLRQYNSMHLDILEFEADTFVIESGSIQVAGFPGRSCSSRVDNNSLARPMLAASGSFFRLNATQCLVSLEIAGRSSSLPQGSWMSSCSAQLPTTPWLGRGLLCTPSSWAAHRGRVRQNGLGITDFRCLEYLSDTVRFRDVYLDHTNDNRITVSRGVCLWRKDGLTRTARA